MTIKIVYRPDNLDYKTFKGVDKQCFPEEPINAHQFDEWVAQEFWAVFDDQELIGYSYLTLKPELGWISRLGVTSRRRNQGFGGRLMETMIDYCQQKNFQRSSFMSGKIIHRPFIFTANITSRSARLPINLSCPCSDS